MRTVSAHGQTIDGLASVRCAAGSKSGHEGTRTMIDEDTQNELAGLQEVLRGLNSGLARMPAGSVSERALRWLPGDLVHRIEELYLLVPRQPPDLGPHRGGA
jgi:hypothetical protein